MGAYIITELTESGDDTGLLSACSNHSPETTSNTETMILAFEYVMLVVPETSELYIEAVVSEVEARLHEGLANKLIQCVAETRFRRLSGEQDEFTFAYLSSLPKDFHASADCDDDEKRENTDCLVIAGLFTVEILNSGSFSDLLAGLTRLMKEFMPPNARRELTETLLLADIDPNLKGLSFRRFIDDSNYAAVVDRNADRAKQPQVGSSKSGGAVAGAAIVGTFVAIAIVVGFLAMQRRRSRRSDDTAIIGITPRHAHTSLQDIHENTNDDLGVYTTPETRLSSECVHHAASLTIRRMRGSDIRESDIHDNTNNDLNVYTTPKSQLSSECGDSENSVSDTEEPQNPLTCASLSEKSYNSSELYDRFHVDWDSIQNVSLETTSM
jgi:hypothetical protein